MGDRAGRPRVAVIGTGGTISLRGRHSLDLFEYSDLGTVLEVDELLARFPEIAGVVEAIPIRFRAVSSTAIGPREWLALNDRVHQVAEQEAGLAGVVITHGTATLEETAYFLNLTLQIDLPVVLVGAQRPPSALSSDAGLNLLNAVRVAAAPQARGLGVLVLLNDEIQAAREVTKTSTYRLETFRSPDLGMLGYADADGQVVIYRAPTRRHAPDTEFDVRGRADLPRVDIAYAYAGADGTVIDALVAAGAEGIVCATLAPGIATPDERRAQRDARGKGVIVVQSSRAGSGRVLSRTALQQEGIVVADNLNPQKARILTMLALTRTHDPQQIQRCFEEY
jgi:L-asparaginase